MSNPPDPRALSWMKTEDWIGRSKPGLTPQPPEFNPFCSYQRHSGRSCPQRRAVLETEIKRSTASTRISKTWKLWVSYPSWSFHALLQATDYREDVESVAHPDWALSRVVETGDGTTPQRPGERVSEGVLRAGGNS